MSDIMSASADVLAAAPVPPPLTEAAPAAAPPAAPRADTPAEIRFKTRVWCTFTFVMCVGMLAVGLWLTPSEQGVETHRQLGLPPCGFYFATGLPCPTCGCTTSVSHFAHGHLLASFLTQPFGFLVALVATLLTPLSVFGMATGRWIGPSVFWLSWHWRTWVYGGLAYLVLAWGYKAIMVKMGYPIH
jgi:hypothetical protein